MQTVKTFGNLAEAGFARSLLEASGIPAFLADEQSSQYSLGAVVPIRLQVPEADFEKALEVLTQGPGAETSSPVAEHDSPGYPDSTTAAQSGIPIAVFAAGALALALLAFAILQVRASRRAPRPQAVEQTYEEDYNHDGRPDHFWTYRGNVTVTSAVDRNFDGKPDEWTFYDQQGWPARGEDDNNFDGRPDAWIVFRNGIPDSAKLDSDFNGRVDWLTTYKDGVVAQSDAVPNETGFVTRRFLFEQGVMREELVDENHDGTFDYRILYDPFGAQSERLPLEK